MPYHVAYDRYFSREDTTARLTLSHPHTGQLTVHPTIVDALEMIQEIDDKWDNCSNAHALYIDDREASSPVGYLKKLTDELIDATENRMQAGTAEAECSEWLQEIGAPGERDSGSNLENGRPGMKRTVNEERFKVLEREADVTSIARNDAFREYDKAEKIVIAAATVETLEDIRAFHIILAPGLRNLLDLLDSWNLTRDRFTACRVADNAASRKRDKFHMDHLAAQEYGGTEE